MNDLCVTYVSLMRHFRITFMDILKKYDTACFIHSHQNIRTLKVCQAVDRVKGYGRYHSVILLTESVDLASQLILTLS